MTTAPSNKWRERAAPLGLFALAFALRFLIARATRFDGLYGQDAFAYLECVQQLLTIRNPCSDFYWPLGYPGLAALIAWGTHGAAPSGAQLASMLTGAAIAPLAYWMATAVAAPMHGEDQRWNMGLAAGMIAAWCGQLVLSSIVVMSDAAGLFWASLSACLLLNWGRGPGRASAWRLPAAAVALAMAIITRWVYAGLVPPLAAYVYVIGWRNPGTVAGEADACKPAPHRGPYRAMVVAALLFTAILAAQLHQNALSPAPVLHHSWLVNWSPLNAWRTSFDNPDGRFIYRWPPALFYAASFVHPLYLCPLLTGCVLLGAWRLRRSPALIVLGGWMTTLYLYLVGIPYENGRFSLALFTPVAVLAGVGLWTVPSLARARSWFCWPLLALSLAITAGFTYRSFRALDSITQAQFAAIRYVQSRVPPGSTVVTFGLSISLAHYTRLGVVDLFMESPQSLRPLVCGAGAPVYVFVEQDNIESQWAGHAPATNLQWLREIGLQQLGTQGTWTFYRVRPCNP